MKFSLSTTTKLYLLTLLLIFGIVFLNNSAFAQSADNNSSPSQKRLKVMNRYMSWIESGDYGEYKTELGKRALAEFKSFLSRVVPEDTACLGQNTPASSPKIGGLIGSFIEDITGQQQPVNQAAVDLSECKKKIKDDHKLAKKYNRILKLLQIQEGRPNVCVKADMGIGTALKARGFNPAKTNSDNPKETGLSKKSTVYLCTGGDGKKKVRVIDDSGTLLKLSDEDAKRPELQAENLPPKESFDILLKKLGLTPASGWITASPNPCTIPSGSQTCGEVEVEWDVTDDTSDPVEVKTADGEFIEKSRNGSADVTNIGKDGETFILYSLGRKIGEVVVKAMQQ
jgi:hypothetical protein